MIDTDLLAVSPKHFVRTLREQLAEVRIGRLDTFGPAGMTLVLLDPASGAAIGSAIVTQADFDGVDWIHASIAFEHEDPAYADMTALKAAAFGPDRPAYMVFAPAAEHVNIHQHALHLYGRADGVRQLPDFTDGMRSI